MGYVGRDVDLRWLNSVEASVRITKQQRINEKYGIKDELVEEKIDALVPGRHQIRQECYGPNPFDLFPNTQLSKSKEAV